jgi:hypothetical protein
VVGGVGRVGGIGRLGGLRPWAQNPRIGWGALERDGGPPRTCVGGRGVNPKICFQTRFWYPFFTIREKWIIRA